MKQVFIQQVTDLAGIPVGHSLLEKLLSAGHSLSVVGDMPSQSSASAEYDRVGNVLKIGNLNVNTSDPYYPARAN